MEVAIGAGMAVMILWNAVVAPILYPPTVQVCVPYNGGTVCRLEPDRGQGRNEIAPE